MERERVANELREFAERRLGSEGDPGCHLRFAMHACRRCEAFAFRVTIERHPGDEPGDFRGIVWTECGGCGVECRLLSVTGLDDADRRPSSSEQPACSCGATAFHVATGERWENWGFFDEGTVVAACSRCGELRRLVDTD